MSRAIRNSSSSTKQRMPFSKLFDLGKGPASSWNFPLSYGFNPAAFKNDIASKNHTVVNNDDSWKRKAERPVDTLRVVSVAKTFGLARVLGGRAGIRQNVQNR